MARILRRLLLRCSSAGSQRVDAGAGPASTAVSRLPRRATVEVLGRPSAGRACPRRSRPPRPKASATATAIAPSTSPKARLTMSSATPMARRPIAMHQARGSRPARCRARPRLSGLARWIAAAGHVRQPVAHHEDHQAQQHVGAEGDERPRSRSWTPSKPSTAGGLDRGEQHHEEQRDLAGEVGQASGARAGASTAGAGSAAGPEPAWPRPTDGAAAARCRRGSVHRWPWRSSRAKAWPRPMPLGHAVEAEVGQQARHQVGHEAAEEPGQDQMAAAASTFGTPAGRCRACRSAARRSHRSAARPARRSASARSPG